MNFDIKNFTFYKSLQRKERRILHASATVCVLALLYIWPYYTIYEYLNGLMLQVLPDSIITIASQTFQEAIDTPREIIVPEHASDREVIIIFLKERDSKIWSLLFAKILVLCVNMNAYIIDLLALLSIVKVILTAPEYIEKITN